VSEPAATPIISIRGEMVGLGPLDRSVIPLQTAWINDWPTTRTLGRDAHPRTLAAHDAWYEHMTSGEERVRFLVYDLEDMAPVGTVGLFDIDRRHGTCELGVGIMAPDRRGKGLGTEATRLITDYAIRGLQMHNVQLSTLEFNLAGIRAYQKAGFTEYGRRRRAWLHNGRHWDIIYMEVLAPEWASPAMARLLAPVDGMV
jgi:RimJ/RimL family protein N-acetyltransferase